MERKLKDILNDLDNGILAPELDYTEKTKGEQIDINKLKYNAFYRDYNYFNQKFPGLRNFPGYDDYIKFLSEKAKTPLEELNENDNQKNISIINNEC